MNKMLKALLIAVISLSAATVMLSGCSSSSEIKPQAGETFIEGSNIPLDFFYQEVGTEHSSKFNLSLEGVTSTAVLIKAFDIDDLTEAKMYVNGTEVALPEGVVADTEAKGVAVEIDMGILKEGENVITFKFADNPRNTAGFRIDGLFIIIRQK